MCVNWALIRDERFPRRAKVPVRESPPVLAGIRAGELWGLAFPCIDCTVADQTLAPMYWRIHLPLRGQHTFG